MKLEARDARTEHADGAMNELPDMPALAARGLYWSDSSTDWGLPINWARNEVVRARVGVATGLMVAAASLWVVVNPGTRRR
jgi:hypothetical protein